MVTEGHYDLHSLVDYDDGLPLDEFLILHTATVRLRAEAQRQMVHNFTIAVGSLFDKNIIRDFNTSMDRIVNQLSPEKSKEEKVRKTMGELQKLNALLG
jgi:hypothetical protein